MKNQKKKKKNVEFKILIFLPLIKHVTPNMGVCVNSKFASCCRGGKESLAQLKNQQSLGMNQCEQAHPLHLH